MIGLIGAHRVGKSTLAGYIAAKYRFKFIPVSISKMQHKHGFDSSNQSYDFQTRMEIQEYLLFEFRDLLYTHSTIPQTANMTRDVKPEPIFDRTPLDLIGYTLIHVTDQLTDEQSAWLLDYIDQCIKLTNEYFTHIMLVQPGIPLVSDNTTSARASAGIIEHLNAVYLAYMVDPRVKSKTSILPREILDMDERANYFKEHLTNV